MAATELMLIGYSVVATHVNDSGFLHKKRIF